MTARYFRSTAILVPVVVACAGVTDLANDTIPGTGVAAINAASLAVSPIFGHNMVLQRGVPVPVFGTADPAAAVTVQFQGQSATTTAGADGTWRVDLAGLAASSSPETMSVTSGTTVVTFTNVNVGEVWLCSGQSNMGRPLNVANGGSAAMADAANHNVRLFRMTGGSGPSTASWAPASATTASNFSAVCYWMGLELSQTLGNVPIGLIQATHDGTSISQWTHTNGGNGTDYDAMVKDIQPFGVKGVAWYQGESDAGDNAYDLKLAGLINEWRTDWGLSLLPFGLVQLTWRPSGWTAAREGQLRASQQVANTFLVVTTDLPVSNYLHPAEKKPVGIRLAIGARGAVYGESIEYSGPVRQPSTSSVSGNTVVIGFGHPGNGLMTSDGKAPGPFRIAGANGRFQSATATIVGNTVRVTSSVAVPKVVRYQWDYGAGNLHNRVTVSTEGGAVMVNRLPASQFELRFP